MKKEVAEFLQNLAAGLSLYIFLFFLYILMAAVG